MVINDDYLLIIQRNSPRSSNSMLVISAVQAIVAARHIVTGHLVRVRPARLYMTPAWASLIATVAGTGRTPARGQQSLLALQRAALGQLVLTHRRGWRVLRYDLPTLFRSQRHGAALRC